MSFVHFLIRFLIFLLLRFGSLFFILDMRPLSDMWFVSISSLSIIYFFIFFTWDSIEEKFLILMRSNLLIFPFVDFTFGVKSKTSLSSPRS